MKIGFQNMMGKSLVTERLALSEERLGSMELKITVFFDR
jgi:hypothetical protein